MDIYLINLAHRKDRMDFMQKQLDAAGLAFKRISAVNGLGNDEIGYPENHPRLSKGEFACYLSHVKCWQALLESGAERCLVLEDDVILASDFKAYLMHPEFYSHDGCLTRLECRPYRTVVSKTWWSKLNSVRLRRLMVYEGGAGAFVLTRAYAKYLLENQATPRLPVDDLMFDPKHTGFRPHRVYQLDPAPAMQRIFLRHEVAPAMVESDLEAGRFKPDSPSATESLSKKAMRHLRVRAFNFRRNLFHVTKSIPFVDAP